MLPSICCSRDYILFLYRCWMLLWLFLLVVFCAKFFNFSGEHFYLVFKHPMSFINRNIRPCREPCRFRRFIRCTVCFILLDIIQCMLGTFLRRCCRKSGGTSNETKRYLSVVECNSLKSKQIVPLDVYACLSVYLISGNIY